MASTAIALKATVAVRRARAVAAHVANTAMAVVTTAVARRTTAAVHPASTGAALVPEEAGASETAVKMTARTRQQMV